MTSDLAERTSCSNAAAIAGLSAPSNLARNVRRSLGSSHRSWVYLRDKARRTRCISFCLFPRRWYFSKTENSGQPAFTKRLKIALGAFHRHGSTWVSKPWNERRELSKKLSWGQNNVNKLFAHPSAKCSPADDNTFHVYSQHVMNAACNHTFIFNAGPVFFKTMHSNELELSDISIRKYYKKSPWRASKFIWFFFQDIREM